MTQTPASTGADASALTVAAGRRRPVRLRRLALLLGVWCLCVGIVGILSWRHGQVVSRAQSALSAASLSPWLASEPDESASNLVCAPSGSDAPVDIALARARALAWVPPVAKDTPGPFDRNAALEVTSVDHVLGSNKAPVTLMLFGDLHCAFTLHLVKTLLGWLDEQPAAFRLVWRHRPIDIHPGAVQAAQIAERLALRRGERSFWRFVFALSEFQGTASESELSELEQALKTRTLLMNESLATSRAAARLERDRLIALGYEIHATPTLFINGLRIEGEISRPHMEQLVNEEKEQVEALLDESVPRAKTYSVRVDANLLDWERE